jgi:hypothetical protein
MSEEGTERKLAVDDLLDLYKRADKLGYSIAGYALHLERQAVEDRAAIRAYILDVDDDPSAPMHDNHGIDEEESEACPLCQWRKVKHAAAIARATQEPK